MGLFDNKIGPTTNMTKAIAGGNTNGSAKSTSVENEPIVKQDLSLNKLAQNLNITREELNELIAKNPRFLKLNEIDQLEYIKKTLIDDSAKKPEGNELNDVKDIDIPEELEKDIKSKYPEIFNEDGIFDAKKLNKIPQEKQIEIYRYALAQNQNRSTWHKLDDKKREEILKNTDLSALNLCKTKTSKAMVLRQEIEYTLAANKFDKNVKDISVDELADYMNAENGYRSNLSKALIEYYNYHPEVLQKLDKDDNLRSHLKTNNVDLTYSEIDKYLTIINESNPDDKKLNANEFLYKHIEEKKNRNISLTKTEEKILNKSINHKKANEIFSQLEPSKTHVLDDFNKSPYAAMLNRQKSAFENADVDCKNANSNHIDIEFEANIYKLYIREIQKTQGVEKAAQAASDLASELREQRPELAHAVIASVINNNEEIQEAITNIKDLKTATFAAVEVNSLSKKAVKALTQIVNPIIKDSIAKAALGEAVAELAINAADDIHYAALGDFAGSDSKVVQGSYAERLYKCKDAKLQTEAGQNIYEKSDNDIKENVATNLDKTQKDAQNPLLEIFSQDKNLAKKINQNGTTTRFDKDNQVEANKIMQNRFEQPDFTPEETQQELEILTDNIQHCHQDNQQAMYEQIMQSSNKAAAQYAQQAYETRYNPVETATANNTSASASASNYQTSPISSNFAETFSTAAPANNNIEFSSPETKSVYEQLVSGGASIVQVTDSFNKLSLSEKQEILKSLPKSELLKMPVSICGFCPEFIPQFVDAHRGLEVLSKVSSATNTVIACMKKKMVSDPEIRKQFMHIAATEPWILSKASQMAAGLDNEQPHKSLQLRG